MIKTSLRQYLNRRYLIVFSFITIIFSALLIYIHWWGMDETSKYYMAYEAQVLSDYYQPQDNIVEFDLGIKEYYWGREKLPRKYQQQLGDAPLQDNELIYYSSKNHAVYILPYFNQHKKKWFFVIHIIANGSSNFANLQIQNVLSIILLTMMLSVLFFMFRTNHSVARQLKDFHLWLHQVTDNSETLPEIPKNIVFTELIDSANTLQTSLAEQRKLQQQALINVQREQHFLSTLSHELRTPIAIILAATTLIEKRNQLSDKDQAALAKLNKATQKMRQLTDTLLQLWRQQPSTEQASRFFLHSVVEQLIEEGQRHLKQHLPLFKTTVTDEKLIIARASLVEMVVSNLINNACQYNTAGDIAIAIDGLQLSIINQIDDNASADNLGTQLQDNTADSIEKYQRSDDLYGFGLGLYLVETICRQQQWQFTTSIHKQQFKAQVIFS